MLKVLNVNDLGDCRPLLVSIILVKRKKETKGKGKKLDLLGAVIKTAAKDRAKYCCAQR